LQANSADWLSTESTVNSNSANWESVYTTTQNNSAEWESAYTDLQSNSSDWLSTENTVNSNSGNWNATYSTVNTLSVLSYPLVPFIASSIPSVDMEYSNTVTITPDQVNGRLSNGAGVIRGMLFIDMANTNVAKYLNVQATQVTPPNWDDTNTTSIIRLSSVNSLKNVKTIVKQILGTAINANGEISLIFQAADGLENDGTSTSNLVSMTYNPAADLHIRVGLDAASTFVIPSYMALSGGFIRIE